MLHLELLTGVRPYRKRTIRDMCCTYTDVSWSLGIPPSPHVPVTDELRRHPHIPDPWIVRNNLAEAAHPWRNRWIETP